MKNAQNLNKQGDSVQKTLEPFKTIEQFKIKGSGYKVNDFSQDANKQGGFSDDTKNEDIFSDDVKNETKFDNKVEQPEDDEIEDQVKLIFESNGLYYRSKSRSARL